MGEEDNNAMTTGIAAVALRFTCGAVLAAHRSGTVDSDTDFYDYMYEETVVPLKLGMLGTTRAATVVGETGEIVRLIEGKTRDRLVEAEKAEKPLEPVKESARYLCRHFRDVDERRLHVEMMVAGWDNVNKDGELCVWYSNHTSSHHVEVNRAIGPGQVYARAIFSRHKIGMSEEEVVKMAEKAFAEAVVGCGLEGGSLDVWVIKDGQIIEKESQSITNVIKKYGVTI